jgi:hypothetical protein
MITVLARSLLAGDRMVEAVGARGANARSILPLASPAGAPLTSRRSPLASALAIVMLFDSSFNPGFARACAKYRHELSIADSLPQCTPAVAAAQRSELPVIETVGDLADRL